MEKEVTPESIVKLIGRKFEGPEITTFILTQLENISERDVAVDWGHNPKEVKKVWSALREDEGFITFILTCCDTTKEKIQAFMDLEIKILDAYEISLDAVHEAAEEAYKYNF